MLRTRLTSDTRQIQQALEDKLQFKYKTHSSTLWSQNQLLQFEKCAMNCLLKNINHNNRYNI